jgi:hypothetical protein
MIELDTAVQGGEIALAGSCCMGLDDEGEILRGGRHGYCTAHLSRECFMYASGADSYFVFLYMLAMRVFVEAISPRVSCSYSTIHDPRPRWPLHITSTHHGARLFLSHSGVYN